MRVHRLLSAVLGRKLNLNHLSHVSNISLQCWSSAHDQNQLVIIWLLFYSLFRSLLRIFDCLGKVPGPKTNPQIWGNRWFWRGGASLEATALKGGWSLGNTFWHAPAAFAVLRVYWGCWGDLRCVWWCLPMAWRWALQQREGTSPQRSSSLHTSWSPAARYEAISTPHFWQLITTEELKEAQLIRASKLRWHPIVDESWQHCVKLSLQARVCSSEIITAYGVTSLEVVIHITSSMY